MYKKILFVFLFLCASYSNADDVLEINLTIKNHHFEPNIIEAPTSRKIRLIVHNMDSMVEEFESHDLNREKIIPPGGKVVIMLAPLEVGEYAFFGEFNPDTAKGILKIKAAE
jgi:hypothetical protein